MLTEFLKRLKNVKKSGDEYTAQCPGHDDEKNSLSITEGNDGRILLFCHAGCTPEHIINALGMKMSDLYPNKEQYIQPAKKIAAVYQYKDLNGNVVHETIRYEPKGFSQRRPDGPSGYIYNLKGIDTVLYRLPEITEAIQRGKTIYICEGEKDCLNLEKLGLEATTSPCGACGWKPQYSEYLLNAQVVIIPDNDQPGRKHVEMVAKSLKGKAKSVKVIELPDLPEKGDVTDFFQAHGKADGLHLLNQLVEDTPEWVPHTETGSCDLNYKCTDAGNCERFADMLKGQYLRMPEQASWYRYDGKMWSEDISKIITQDIIKGIRQAQKDALVLEDDDRRAKVLRWLLSSESKGRIESALSLMESVPFLCGRIGRFDSDDMLLNVQNGTVDLRTGELRPHSKNDLLTKICNVAYTPSAKSDRFETFLDEITEGNTEKKRYLQKLSGYCCSGKISQEEFYQWKGPGGNGKTKLAELLKYVLGSYAVTASPDILMAKDMASIPNDIARLRGARLVLMSEPDPGKRFSDNAIKSLTGGDTIIARFLHKEFFEFQMKAKMIMLTNHEIRAIGTDHGLWRRMVVIPFNYQVPEVKRDKNLQEKLIADAEAVLAWMVQGCLMWQKEGLEQPEELVKVKDEYRMGQDAIGLFIDECCIEEPKAKINATELYKAYTQWCQDTGEYELTQRLFGSRLREKGFTSAKAGSVYWFGIKLLDKLDLLDKKAVNSNKNNTYSNLPEKRPNCPNGPNKDMEWWEEAEANSH